MRGATRHKSITPNLLYLLIAFLLILAFAGALTGFSTQNFQISPTTQPAQQPSPSDVAAEPALTLQPNDWIITGKETCTDAKMIDSNIIISNGGELTMDNCNLTIISNADGQHKIVVESGGTLNIQNSRITKSGAAYLFWVEQGAVFSMTHTKLSGAGFEKTDDGRNAGLWIGASGVTIKNNLIKDGYAGIVLAGSSNNDISKNTFGNVRVMNLITASAESNDFGITDFTIQSTYDCGSLFTSSSCICDVDCSAYYGNESGCLAALGCGGYFDPDCYPVCYAGIGTIVDVSSDAALEVTNCIIKNCAESVPMINVSTGNGEVSVYNVYVENSTTGISIQSGNVTLWNSTFISSGYPLTFNNTGGIHRINDSTFANNTYGIVAVNDALASLTIQNSNITNSPLSCDLTLEVNNPINLSSANISAMKSFRAGITTVSSPPNDTAGIQNISLWFNATNLSASSWAFVNVTYNESLLGSVNEADLLLYHHNGSAWLEVPNSNVNTAANYVYGNISSFSIFAPMGPLGGGGPTQIDNCTTISTNGSYILNQSITGNQPSGKCIDIQTANVTLDCLSTYNITGNVSGTTYGIYTNSSNTTIQNCYAQNYAYGIYLSSSSNNNLTGNTFNNNNDAAAYIYSSSNNQLTGNNFNNNNYYGIYFQSSSYNNLTGNNASNNRYDGINLYQSSYNNLTGNNASNNSVQNGIYLYSSSYNTITNNTMQENAFSDLRVSAESGAHCANYIVNNTGSNGLPIRYYNASTTLADIVLSELVLCNADSSSITNVTIDASQTKSNNGLFLVRTDYSNITSSNSTANLYGIYLSYSLNNNLTNNTANNNTQYGIYLSTSSNNILIDNTVYNSNQWDFYSSNTALNNTAYNLMLTTANVSFNGDNFAINASTNPPTALKNISKYFNATNTSDTGWAFINVSYADGDLGSVSENSLGLYRYNGTDWSQLATTGVDTTNNYVWGNATQFSTFAPLGGIACGDTITADTTLTADLGPCTYDGLIIGADNITLDCNGHTITGPASSIGRGVNITSRSNVTIKNCTINTFEKGIYAKTVQNSQLINNTIYTTSQGIFLMSSTNISVTSNIAYNTIYGIYLSGSNSNNTLTNNTVYNNYDTGIYVYSNSINNNLTGNNASYNTNYGIYLVYASSSNILKNNIAHHNAQHGIYLDTNCNFNNLTNNTAYSNGNRGFYIDGSHNNTLTNNTANNNWRGLGISGENNTLTNNVVYGSTDMGIHIDSSSMYNTLVNNTANNNTNYGIYISYSNNNTLTNNTANNNSQYGFYVYNNADSNFFTNNRLCGNVVNDTYFTSDSNSNTGSDICDQIQDLDTNTGYSCPHNCAWVPPTPIDNCTTISTNGSYILNTSINYSGSGICISISASNVTLDCDDYVINGTGFNGYGISASGRVGLIIQNCTILNFERGISLISNSNYNNLTGNNATYNRRGIYIESSKYNRITGNNLSYNSWTGAYVSDANNSTLIGNNASYTSSGDGIYLEYSNSANVMGNNVSNNSYSGIYLFDSSYNNLTGNTANNNTQTGGIIIATDNSPSSRNNTLINNTANYNKAGITVNSGCNNTLLINNNVYYSNNTGLYVSSDYNNITNNTACYTITSTNYDIRVSLANNAGDNTCDVLSYDSSTVTCNTTCPPLPPVPITSCQALTQRGITYILQNNVSIGSGTCFSITNRNVTLDCNGSTITGPGSSGSGISTSQNFTTIKNCSVTGFASGVSLSGYFDRLENSTIYNNAIVGVNLYGSNDSLVNSTITNNGNSDIYGGIYLSGSAYSNVADNIITKNKEQGIYIQSGANNTLNNNTIYNNTKYGIVIESDSKNNFLTNNTIYNHTAYYGVYLRINGPNSPSNNTLINNTIIYNKLGIYFESSSNNTLINNTINNNNGTGISFQSSSNNNTLTGNNVSYNGLNGIGLYFNSNSTLTGNTVYHNVIHGILLMGSSSNSINSNYVCDSFTSDINLTSSSNSNTGDNTCDGPSGNISGNPGLTCNTSCPASPEICNNNFDDDRDGYKDCLDSDCTSDPYCSYNLTACGQVMNISGARYTLQNDVNSTGSTCFSTGNANYTILDCDNKKITGVGSNYGIVGGRGTTIENCTVIYFQTGILAGLYNNIIGNTIKDNTYDGIWLLNALNNNLTGNTVNNSGYIGIDVQNSNYSILIGNNVSYSSYAGIDLYQGSNNNILINNTAYKNPSTGISLDNGANYNNLTGNNASYSTSGNDGIRLGYNSYNILINNTANNNNYGMAIQYANYTTLIGNNASNCYTGITIGSNSPNSTLIGNNVGNNSYNGIRLISSANSALIGNTAYNNSNYGISIDNSNYTNLTDNNVTYNDYGIYISSSRNNTLVNNIAFNNTKGSNKIGIYLTSSNNNTLYNNAASNNRDGLVISSGSNNRLYGNDVSNGSRYGVSLSSSSTNYLINNTVYNNNNRGISLESNSNYNDIINNTLYINDFLYSQEAIVLSFSSYNNIINNTADANYDGIWLSANSSNNILHSNIVTNSMTDGIGLAQVCTNNTLINNTVYNNYQNGLVVYNGSNNMLINNTVYNNQWDFKSFNGAFNNTAYNLMLSTANVSFNGDNFAINASTNPPAAANNISKYFNATNTSTSGWAMINVSYAHGDLGTINENTLKLFHYNGATWDQLTNTGVNTTDNYVWGNATQFSTFAPLDSNTAPQINLNLPSNNTQFNNTWNADLNFTAIDDYNTTFSCDIYLDNAFNQTNASTGNYTLTNFLISGISYGYHNWTVNCTDGLLSNVSETKYFTIADTQAPIITHIRPVQNDIIGYTVTLEVNATDNMVGVNSVWYQVINTSGIVKSGIMSGTEPIYTDSWNTSTVSEGNYTFTAYANDTVGNQANSPVNFTIDNTPPFIQIFTPLSSSLWNSNFNLNVSIQNYMLNASSYNITNSSAVVVQSNSNNSIYQPTYNWNDLVNVGSLPSGTYNLTVYAVNNVGYAATESVLFGIDRLAPQYSNLIATPASPTTYSPGGSYQFNATWDDNVAVSNVVLNFAGGNYSVSNASNEYYRTFSDLAVGVYNYIWYADDTVSPSNWNDTGILTYNITPATPVLTITNSTPTTVTYGTPTSISCNSNTAEVTPQLYRNGSSVGLPDAQTLGVGTYDYICNNTATQNYTSTSATPLTVTVNIASTIVNLTLNGNENNVTVTYPQTVTAVFSTNAASATMYRNGTNVSAENNSAITLAVGYYNYTVINSGNANYTESSKTFFVTVNPQPTAVDLYLNGNLNQNVSISYGTPSNATAVGYNGTATLYRDGSTFSSPDINTLGVNAYNYTVEVPGDANHTGSSKTFYLNVTPAASSIDLYINGSAADLIVEAGSVVNLTATLVIPGSGSVQLYRNGSLIQSGNSPQTNMSNFSALGVYNITAVYPATTNYSLSSSTHFVTAVTTALPIVNLQSPANGAAVATRTQNFTFNVRDNYYATLSCTLYINDVARGTNSSVAINTATTIPNVNASEGNNSWYVNCTDGSANTGKSPVRALIVDTIKPQITVAIPPSPANNSVQTSKTLELHTDVNDSQSAIDTCILEFDGVNETMMKVGTGLAVQCKSTKTLLDRTDHNYTIYANDTVGNMARNGTWFFTIREPGPPLAQGGTGVPSKPTYNYEVFEGRTYNVTVGDTVTIVVKGQNHTVKLTDVTPGYVAIDIMSPLRLTLTLGEVQDVDVDENGLNDLRVELLYILLPNSAAIKFTQLSEAAPEVPAPPITPEAPTAPQLGAPTALFTAQQGSLLTFAIFMVIAFLAYSVWKRSKRKIEGKPKKQKVSAKPAVKVGVKTPAQSLQDYVVKELAKGHTEPHIREQLSIVGWEREAITKALNSAKREIKVLPENTAQKLHKYVSGERAKGHGEKHIRENLSKAGWEREVIGKALKKAKQK